MADEDWDIDDADVQVKGLSLDADDDDEVAELEAKVKADPNNADLLAQLAAAQHESGDDAGAIDNYTKAIGIDAKAGYYYNLGLAYKANDEAKEAQGAFEDAVKQDPKHAGATLALGNIALDAGNTEEALKHFATVRSIDASNVDAHAIPAQILQSKGSADELKEAAGLLETAVKLDGSNEQNRARLVQVYDALGDADNMNQARSALHAAFAAKELSDAYTAIGRFCCSQFTVGDNFVMAYDHSKPDGKVKYAFLVFDKKEVRDDKVLYRVTLEGGDKDWQLISYNPDKAEIEKFGDEPSFQDVKAKVQAFIQK